MTVTEMGALQAKYENFYTPRFRLTVGSETITETDGRISGLSITTALDRANRVSFTLSDVFDHEAGAFDDVAWSTFSPGTRIDVELGYGDAFERLVVGRIDAVQPTFPANGAPSVSVSAQDLRKTMMAGSSSDSWDEATLDDVASGIAENYPFRETTIGGGGDSLSELGSLTLKKLVKNADSDYSFLAGLADAFGYELFSRAGGFHFRKPQRDASPVLRLQYGRSLTSFRPGQPGGDSEVGTVEVRHWDEKAAETIVGTASREEGDDKRVRRIPVESEEEATERAEAILETLTRGDQSQGETQGLPELQIGRTIELAGLGDRFSGTYYVEEATHRIDRSGYATSFTVTETDT